MTSTQEEWDALFEELDALLHEGMDTFEEIRDQRTATGVADAEQEDDLLVLTRDIRNLLCTQIDPFLRENPTTAVVSEYQRGMIDAARLFFFRAHGLAR
jgi:hypothetical protein